MADRSPLIAAMLDAAFAAGEGLKRDFANIAQLQVQHKQGLDDMFSEADLRAEQTVRERLSSFRPEYGFLGEEGGLVAGDDPDNVWIVDPLDGTTNFLIGLPLFAVNIALATNGRAVAGVTHIPLLDETFWAERGQGAYLNDQPIHISSRQQMIEAVLGVGIPFASKPRHEQFAAEMARLTPIVSGIRRLGAAAVDMAYVACGRFDAYWEQSINAWDIAAGVVIVEEAGGIVTDTLGQPLVLDNGTVLASVPQLHSELVDAIAPVDG
ncbi:inositol monophosphatase [Sphingomonas sp. NSE70-1]|uniref:Inositol-1-monophosphatase n=1 Tax=Sphingomonas caseinilyticus TaxID=2908205 RepID=A0ABT0RWW0_9SPHN|nr:inositol monophosphatase family protein [Sphingomonas caseinilyticus]MCL6699515.1 inositol monophosphatase [Sphingomonas caseinilyticus]